MRERWQLVVALVALAVVVYLLFPLWMLVLSRSMLATALRQPKGAVSSEGISTP